MNPLRHRFRPITQPATPSRPRPVSQATTDGVELDVSPIAPRAPIGHALVVTLLSLLVACAKTTGTETGNPPVLSRLKVSVSAVDAATVEVAGEGGAVTPGGGSVTVENTRTGDVETAPVADDGSFSVNIPGTPEDDFTVTADQDGVRSDPQTVGPGSLPTAGSPAPPTGGAPPNASDWQTLHACSDRDPMAPVRVDSVSLDGDTMEVTFGHGGGCGQHLYGLCYETEWAESFPIQLGFRVLHDDVDNDSCEAFLTQTERWDLAPFRQAYADAYRTDSGAAQITLADCEGSNCAVVYRWP